MSRVLVHVTASRMFGGPERQILGLAGALPADEFRTVVVTFAEDGLCASLLQQCRRSGVTASAIPHELPYLRAAAKNLQDQLLAHRADLLVAHGYKAGILGRVAARRLGLPIVAISRGWTGEGLKIRAYELLDRINLRWMDRIVCVSESQAQRLERWRVPRRLIVVIPNAIDTGRFSPKGSASRRVIQNLFSEPVRFIVGAAGRLSPEKGFDVLIEAAAETVSRMPNTGFVLFGDGPQRVALAKLVAARGLYGRFILAGYRDDMDRLLPACDVFVQSSYTEGMPNVVLEACAAGVPVIATAVGGTPEIVRHGTDGWLVQPGLPSELARPLVSLLKDASLRQALGRAGQQRMHTDFTFKSQADRYRLLIEELLGVCESTHKSLGMGQPVP
jgi:glycosyltransferase involved in cell wall biosynthesis